MQVTPFAIDSHKVLKNAPDTDGLAMASPATAATPQPATPAPRPKRHPLTRVGLYGLYVNMIQAIAVVVVGLGLAAHGDRLPDPLTPEGTELLILSSLLLLPLLLLLTRAMVRVYDGRDMRSIAWTAPRGGWRGAQRQALLAGALTVLFLLNWFGLVGLWGGLAFRGLDAGFVAGPAAWPGPIGSILRLALLMVAFMCQGTAEEVAIRGYTQHALEERWRWAQAALMSSALFSFVHALNPGQSLAGLVNTFLIGLGLSLIVRWTGSLWAASIVHGLWNFFVAIVLSLPISGFRTRRIFDLELRGPAWLTGGEYGPESSLILTVMLVATLGALWSRYRRSVGDGAAPATVGAAPPHRLRRLAGIAIPGPRA